MQSNVLFNSIVSATVLVPGLVLYGCESPPGSKSPETSAAAPTRLVAGPALTEPATPVAAPPVQPTQQIAPTIDARPAALVNGKPLTWAEVRATLCELAGAEALQEVVLDMRIKEALAAAAITITEDDVAAERKNLLESLSDDPDHALRLLDELRDRQKLGKTRFDALMRRNASLRALVKDNVKVTDEAVRNMHELLHGPRRQARIMILPNLDQAQAAINLVNSGVSFADVAVEMSTDSSAPRGGLLEPISRVDPAYPESVRQTLWTLNPGEMSGPVLVDDHYAVIMLVKRVAGDGIKIEDARTSLERTVRLQQERLLMDQFARSLIAETQVTVFDDALNESWSRRKSRNNAQN